MGRLRAALIGKTRPPSDVIVVPFVADDVGFEGVLSRNRLEALRPFSITTISSTPCRRAEPSEFANTKPLL